VTARLEAKTDANLREMKAEIKTNNKFEVLSTLVFWMDIHQAWTEAVQEEK
jgi:hypothetical protein